ncbi:MAG: pyruvate carboxylase, partial [Bacteroidia bacterium]|nr:pyruvate carboxylase [Bacteroidia bacterium]
QILGDQYGNLLHLFERDCSVQRRFQKVVEIAPAPSLSPSTKQKLYDYSLQLAKAAGYYNAGTVEYLVDSQENIYFIEVNPRIQVEHTVTEQVTGIDLVRSQIVIAAGFSLSHPNIHIPSQEDLKCNGYAIQCRITTEDPENNFKPDFGKIVAYRNAGGFGIRLDEGSSYPGVTISPFFDSMLVKITASGRTLRGACQRMYRTLQEFRIRGVKTNIPFLENVVRHPEFQEGKATVSFIETHPELFQFTHYQDRGTRTLKYLAEVIVNGNPDITVKHDRRSFEKPIVPEYDKFIPPPAGTKQLLTQLGPEQFCNWLLNQKAIQYTDTTFRDAHQSLLATRVRTIDLLKIASSFAYHHPNLFSMEVWGGATFDVALRFLHECPWERLRLLRQAIPNILLQMLFRGSNAVGYAAYPDNLIIQFIEQAWETGIDVFRIFDSLNWLEGMKVSIQAVRERTGGLAEACICYTGDILNPARKKYDLNYYITLAKRIEDAGAHILGIKDMAGLLKPYAAEVLISELKKVISIPIHLHTHDTAGIQCATYLKAVEAGVDVIDVAIASMSGLTSQPNFNSIVEMLNDSPRKLPIDVQSLNRFSNYWEAVRAYYYPFESGLQAGTAEVYQHEIPGGQYSNLKPQAISLGLGEYWEEIKHNFKVVNELFGDIVKVTPSSKVVGDMALFMTSQRLTAQDILEKGDTISFPESVKSLFRGDIGQPEGGFPEKLQKIILKDEKPYTDRPNAHIPPIDIDSDFVKFQEKFGKHYNINDYLSYQFFPKVFEEYHEFRQHYGNVSHIPTPEFFFGMVEDQECILDLDNGKTLIIKFLYMSKPDEDGIRAVYFKLNGQTRTIEVRDRSAQTTRVVHQKATAE